MTGIFPARPTSKAVTKYTYGPILHKIWAQPVFKKKLQWSTVFFMWGGQCDFCLNKYFSTPTYCSLILLNLKNMPDKIGQMPL